MKNCETNGCQALWIRPESTTALFSPQTFGPCHITEESVFVHLSCSLPLLGSPTTILGTAASPRTAPPSKSSIPDAAAEP
jgi:hypothetical protein